MTDPFDDLDDHDYLNDPTYLGRPGAPLDPHPLDENGFGDRSTTPQGAYTEPCTKCSGTGRFISYAGRDVGACFACKGAGRRTYRTPPEHRARQRQRKADRKAQREREQAARTAAFAETELGRYLMSIAGWNQFAASLLQAVGRWGELTDKQRQAAEQMMARDAEQRPAGLDLTDVPSGHYAVPDGSTRLKVRIRHIDSGKWAGWCFVDDGAAYGERQQYGRQRPGDTYAGKITDQLRAIAADPQAAMVAYGRLVGRCGVCNRILEDEISVANGIGPVCAGRLGWHTPTQPQMFDGEGA